jgi:hypothetical protein
MQPQKEFHQKDAFFIAEAIDSLVTTVLIPHDEKEFHDKDAFIIWQKIQAILIPPPPPVNSTNLLFVKISLTPPQIQNLNSIPVLAIAAPGANKAIRLVEASANLAFVLVAYTSSTVTLTENGVASSQGVLTFFLDSIASNFKSFSDQSLINNVVNNSGLFIQATADSLVGDSPVDVYISYRIIDL